jgi:hypothetical protein
MYVFAPNGTVAQYPYSIADLKTANPNVSFPADPTDQTLAEWDVFPVIKSPAPTYDSATQNLNQVYPVLNNEQWLQTWQVSDASAEEITERIRANADYLAFWYALMSGTVYDSIREQSMVSLPMNTLATEFIALLGDAKAGRPNEAAIQASMDAILLNGTFTNDQLTELAGALETGKLDSLYTLA